MNIAIKRLESIGHRLTPRRRVLRVSIGITAVLTLLMAQFPTFKVQAGTLTTPRIYLTRQQANISTGIGMDVFFTTATAVSGGAGTNKVVIVFPNDATNNTKWCRTVGTGDLTVTGVANPVGATESATVLPGTLTGACTQSPDTITISGVNDLSISTKYGVRIAQNSSTVLGTAASATDSIQTTVKTNNGSSDVDTQTIALSVITADQVSVTATVNPTLTVLLSGTSAALSALSLTQINQASITSTVTTNAPNGYVSMVKYNNTLTNLTSDTISDTNGTIAAGESEFGASTSASSQTISTWNPTSCANTASTSTATALTTSYQSFASATAAVSSQTTTLCFLAGMSTSTKPGSYTSTATLVTTAKF